MTDPTPAHDVLPDDLRPLVQSERRLIDVGYLAFPFRTDPGQPVIADRADHVRQQIEQVLFTAPGERPHRPSFGIGVEQLVFEPNADALRAVINQHLTATLAETLHGEIDPASLTVDVSLRGEETLVIRIGYRVATIGRDVEHVFEKAVSGG